MCILYYAVSKGRGGHDKCVLADILFASVLIWMDRASLSRQGHDVNRMKHLDTLQRSH